MNRYALIQNGLVITVVEQAAPPTLPGYTAVDVTAQPPISAGYTWDGTTFFAPVRWGWMRAREFLRQFNRTDRTTIKGSADPIVVDALWQLQVVGLIDFADPDMQAFMDQLVTLNVISNGKKARIYAAARFEALP